MPGKSLYQQVLRWLWALVLVSLPVTSFRYFPFFGGDTYVRPLALYPLALLFPLLVIQGWRNWRASLWHNALMPLVLFALAALTATAIGCLFAPLDLYNQDYWGRALRGWVTLAVGLAFLLSAIWSNRSEDDLRFSIRWLLAGLVLHLLWGSVQASSLFLKVPSKKFVDTVQELFSVRGVVKAKRVSGLTFEPSWLAGQILTLYLPWLFASILKGYHISRFRWLEAVLAGLALGLTLVTYSRSGLAMILIVAGVTLLIAGREHLVHAWQWAVKPVKQPGVRTWVVRLAVLVISLGVIGGIGLVLVQSNYFSHLWQSTRDDLLGYLVDINVGPRVAYVWGAWNVFQAHPWTGVGLGAAGFYLLHALPDWALTSVAEIAKLVSPDNHIYPNAKNLYLRLLAETGIFGFWAFACFYATCLARVRAMLQAENRAAIFLGAAGTFACLGVMLYGFSQDSLAAPEIWISIGILLGVAGQMTAAAPQGQVLRTP